MKQFFLLALALLSAVFAMAQEPTSVEAIKMNPNYKWGEGTGYSLEEADQAALDNLVKSISVSVSTGFDRVESQSTYNNQVEYNEDVESRIKTYSFATLQNVGQIILSEEPAHVFRYVAFSEIQKSFDLRAERAKSFLTEGAEALEEARIGDALKYHYWALVLLNTLPDGATMKCDINGDGTQEMLYTWCYERITSILDNLEIQIGEVQNYPTHQMVILKVAYAGVPVANLDYQYWMGQRYSSTFSVKDGRGTAEVSHIAKGDQLKLKIEYQYAHIAKNMDAELRGCFERNRPSFPLNVVQKFATLEFDPLVVEEPKAKKQKEKSKRKESEEQVVSATANDLRVSAYARNQELPYEMVQFDGPLDPLPYVVTMQQVEQAIRSRNYESVMTLFTPDGYEMFQKIIAYGKASLLEVPTYDLILFGDHVICRSLPMQFKFSASRTFVEDVVFRFAEDGRIDSVAFSLSDSIEALLFDAGFQWDNASRLQMMEFMENYKTAYSLERLDYINSVFSDTAIIIVGKMLQAGQSRIQDTTLLNDPEVEYRRYTKEQYMRKLEQSFRSKEYINIHFEDIDIAKMRGGEIYAIHIQQNYYSNNYTDTGYLTLLVDMRKPEEPMIHVRVWNPKRDPNFTAISFLQEGASLLD